MRSSSVDEESKAALRHSDQIEMRWIQGKGRGVFARVDIKTGTIIEVAPVITVPAAEAYAWHSSFGLYDYVFSWDEGTMAIALGYGSLYNHSFVPNAKFSAGTGLTIIFKAIRPIRAGTEITINYNGPAYSRAAMHFPVQE
jgi:SET domain-containing protein